MLNGRHKGPGDDPALRTTGCQTRCASWGRLSQLCGLAAGASTLGASVFLSAERDNNLGSQRGASRVRSPTVGSLSSCPLKAPSQTHRTSSESCSSSSDSESARRRRKLLPVTGMVAPAPRSRRRAPVPRPGLLPARSSAVRAQRAWRRPRLAPPHARLAPPPAHTARRPRPQPWRPPLPIGRPRGRRRGAVSGSHDPAPCGCGCA